MDDLDAQVDNTILAALASSIVLLVVAIVAAYLVIRGISNPLKDVHNALQSVADENVSIKIPHTDMANEVGMMAKATLSLQEKVRERHALSNATDPAGYGTRQRAPEEPAPCSGMKPRPRPASSPPSARRWKHLARGDLTVRCADLGQKYAALRDNFNDALSHLEAAMAKVSAKGSDIGASKEEIRRASNELSQRTERQAASLEETSAALDELTVAVRQTAEGAHEASKRVHAVSTEASRSDAVVTEAIDRDERHREVVCRDRQDHRRHRRDRLPDEPASA